MGLDATVYCNCFETGQLKEAPPYSIPIYVSDNGNLYFKCDDLEITLALDRWLSRRACMHRDGHRLRRRIGNVSLVATLRAELARQPDKFPVLLNKVLYNGIHAGDHLSLDDVARLRIELMSLDTLLCSDPESKEYVESFKQQMSELADASLSVGKPISF